MRTAITIEYRKFFSTRLWWVLLTAMVLYMAFLAALMALTLTSSPESLTGPDGSASPAVTPVMQARSIYTIATAMGYIFPTIIGALSVTGEFRHKTITPTLLAEPNRTRLITAKLLGSIPIGALFGVAGTAAGVAAGGIILQVVGDGAMLGEPEVWASIGLSVVALTVWTMLGVGLGTLMTNQVAVIVALLAFTQFVEPGVRAVLTTAFDGRLAQVATFMPGSAGESITGASIYSTIGLGGLLPWWQGALVLIVYALAFAALGRMTTFRRDLT